MSSLVVFLIIIVLRYFVELPAHVQFMADPLLVGWGLYNFFHFVKAYKDNKLDRLIESRFGSLFSKYVKEEKKVMISFLNLLKVVPDSMVEDSELVFDSNKKSLFLGLAYILPIEGVFFHLLLNMLGTSLLVHGVILVLECYALIWTLGLYNRIKA